MYREREKSLDDVISEVRVLLFMSYGHNYNWGTLKILLLSQLQL